MLVEALKRAGRDLTREKFITPMKTIKDFQTDFYPGPISFSPTNHIGNNSGTFATFMKGKKVEHIGSKCAKLRKIDVKE